MTSGEAESNVLKMLHWTVRDRADSLPDESPVRKDMEHLAHKLRVARYLLAKQGPIRIGVFGLFSRGKSMLVNALIGERFMPDSVIPTTGAVVEIKHSLERTVVVHFNDGKIVPRKDFDTVQEVHDTVEKFGTKEAGGECSVKKIVISWPLDHSELMRKGYVLVDTPGAKSAADKDGATGEDTKRALQELEKTHVVLLCLRADYLGDEEERKFCTHHVQWLDPLFVINFKDLYDGKSDLIDYVTNKVFWVEKRKAVSVSALDALKAKEQHPPDEKMQLESNIRQLEKRIEETIEGFAPINVIHSVLTMLELYAGTIGRPRFPVWENLIEAAGNPSYLSNRAVSKKLDQIWPK